MLTLRLEIRYAHPSLRQAPTLRSRSSSNTRMEFVRDVRIGFRLLRRAPAFAATAVLTLALGIGATTALFTVVNAVLLESLPTGSKGSKSSKRSKGIVRPGYQRFAWRFRT